MSTVSTAQSTVVRVLMGGTVLSRAFTGLRLSGHVDQAEYTEPNISEVAVVQQETEGGLQFFWGVTPCCLVVFTDTSKDRLPPSLMVMQCRI